MDTAKYKIRVNMVSESDITVQGHGVHTAYDELATALAKRSDVALVRGKFGKTINCDIVHLHTIGPRVWRKLMQKNVKKVVSVHVIPASFVGSIVLAKYWLPLARRYMRWFYGRADKLLAVSDMVAGELRSELGLDPDKIETFYNTIDMSRYAFTPGQKKQARERLGLAKNAFIVLGNGQVQPRKHPEAFTAMANALTNIQFIWVGGVPFKHLGADYAKMQVIMDSVPDNMQFTGVIPHSQVADYLAAADVFCLPADQENHPMCVLEAAGANLPIILRDLPEYNDTFNDDMIRCKTDADFIEAVEKLQSDPMFYKEIQQKSQAIARRFDSLAAAERAVAIYRSLI